MEMAAKGNRFKYSGEAMASDPAWRVVIAIGPSRLAFAWAVLVGTLGVAACVGLPEDTMAKVALAGAVVAASVLAARRHGWQAGAGGIRRLVVDLSGHVEIDRADGSRAAGLVLDGSFVLPWLTVVRWRPCGARWSRSVLIAPDAVAADDFRRLRVLLRWR
jgi:toxin CptA